VGQQASYLIIGNGIAGVTAAEVLRSADRDSAITIVADDPSPVYYRPALKDFLGGHVPDKMLWARPNTFYQNHHINFIAGRVTAISPSQHRIRLQNGEQQQYDKLLLANGARPRHLQCPGTDLAGVSTLRTITDYQEILRRLPDTARIVICGSGTLALESAETLHALGHQVTHLLRKQTLWSEILDSTASDMILQEERRAGIDVHLEETVAEIVGKHGQVTHVITTRGTRIPCDLLLIAIGIAPNIDFIQASGIACGQGVKVDAAMRTNAPDIYAVGDVTETTDASTGHTRILGQWFPAIQQARTAAYSMLDQYDNTKPGTFYNATFLYGLDFVSLGITSQKPDAFDHAHSYQEIIAAPAPRSYRKVLLKDGMPIGALFLGERKQALAFKRAIDARVNMTPILTSLFTEDFCLEEWLDRQHAPEAIFDITRNADKETVSHAYLIPLPHPKVTVATRETLLDSQSQNNLIGRQAGMTLTIEHSSISRKHAVISFINGQYILRDLSSSNGTFVNTLPLSPDKTHILHPDDTIRFGDVQFRFQLRQQPIGVAAPQLVTTQNSGETAANLFQHILGSPLERNTVRSIPEALLATARETPSLILLMKNAEPRILPLAPDQLVNKRLTMGRDKNCAIVLQDTAASRKHAELFTAPDGLYIRDFNSSNGVFVNKVRINNPYHLSRGDRIVIGNTLIYCSLPQKQAVREHNQPDPYNNEGVPFTTLAQESEKKPEAVTIGHRSNIEPLSEKRVQFEIDMCVGCNRCMNACPLPLSTQVHIADLNQANVSDEIAPHVARFTHECIMCGSCVPVCPVDNHRDLLMLSLKQRLGSPWDSDIDVRYILDALPPGWSVPRLINRLREQPILGNMQLIPENYLLHLFAHSQLLTLAAGITLLHEGEYGRDLYILLEGRLSVSTTEAKGKELQVAIINRGEYTGEYGMLTGQPYDTTVSTLTPALILQVPEQVIQHFMELVPKTRHFFEQLNNVRSIEGILKRMALFQGISDADIHALVEQTHVQHYDRAECLFSEDDRGSQRKQAGTAQRGRPARETLHILLEGFVKVARQTSEKTGQNTIGERIIAYRQGGDYFAGGLDLLGDGRAVTVTAITRTRVAEVPRSTLLALFKRYPEIGQRFTARLHQYIESTTNAQSRIFEERLFNPQIPQKPPAPPAVRAGLHALISDGVVEGTEVLVIDLDKCIHCNECEEACARRHGHSRMNRKGMVVGNISIATACRQCQDPVCMLCSRAGIARRPNGEVYITESCIGCGICAERCPYGAISIVDLDEEAISTSSRKRFSSFFTKGAGKERSRKSLPMANSQAVIERRVSSGPMKLMQAVNGYDEMRKKVAIKCDLCAEYSDQACVQACPTGAAIRVQPTKFFGSTEEILQKRTHL
jgi:NADPH-dependent 2,4-dienoyl-CoA reductase/sulfur reductase-like enzyme/CRP-like cAMP-binding protein/pSer/pThr/pTyr-binding forkhead associated (FHA) protein/Fe-S-cluster-containing hydrogenase component 2